MVAVNYSHAGYLPISVDAAIEPGDCEVIAVDEGVSVDSGRCSTGHTYPI
jgi:hypothetical protein